MNHTPERLKFPDTPISPEAKVDLPVAFVTPRISSSNFSVAANIVFQVRRKLSGTHFLRSFLVKLPGIVFIPLCSASL
jgi:hypothetical protein